MGSHFDPTNYWNPSPRNLNRMAVTADEAERQPSPGPSRPVAATSSSPGRPAVPSPLAVNPNSAKDLLNDLGEQLETLSNASKDSFDWVGDERVDDEDYEEILREQLEAKPTSGILPPQEPHVGFWKSILPINFSHNILLFIFVICLGIFLAHTLRVPLPHILDISLFRWAVLLFLIVFLPVWINTGILKCAHGLRSICTRQAAEIPARLEDMRHSIALILTSIFVGAYWMSHFPVTCALPPPVEDPSIPVIVPICYYAYAPRLFLFLIITGVVTALDNLLMSTIRSSFQEKNFKTRVVENRFKIFVIDQLLLAAKQEKYARQLSRQGSSPLASGGARDTSSTSIKPEAVARDFMVNLPFLLPEQLRRLYRKLQQRRRQGSGSGTASRVGLLHLGSSDATGTMGGDFDDFKKEFLQTIQAAGFETVAKAPPRSDLEAKLMARMVFHYLCPVERNFLTIEDFRAIISNEAASRDAYNVFDYDKDGTITKSEFRAAIVRIFREQRNLTQSVANTGSALSILDTMSLWIVGAGLFLLALALIGVKVQSILAVMASVILGLNFIVFDGANKTFGALLFLFLMHPYDVGDRVVIGRDLSNEEEILTVIEINIQNTIFKKWNGLIVHTPNHVLAGSPITNLSRATEQWERVEFELYAPDQHRLTIDEETEKLAELRRRIDAFVRSYSQDYYQAFELRALIAADNAKADKNLDKLRFVLKIRCRETIDSQKRWIRHARILAFVKQAVQGAGVEFAATAA